MDLKSATAASTSLAENAAKSALRMLWTYAAVHPRSAVLIALALILASGIVGFAIGVGV